MLQGFWLDPGGEVFYTRARDVRATDEELALMRLGFLPETRTAAIVAIIARVASRLKFGEPAGYA